MPNNPSLPGSIIDPLPRAGRRIRGRRRNHLEHQKYKIEARLAAIDARERIARRKRDTRANIVLGAVLRAHAALHPAFLVTLADILHTAIRRPADRELLASVLGLPHLLGDTENSKSGAGGSAAPLRDLPTPGKRAAFVQHAASVTKRR